VADYPSLEAPTGRYPQRHHGKKHALRPYTKNDVIAALPKTTHVPMRLHDVTPRWGYMILTMFPRLTPGVIEIVSLRDASCARWRFFVWTVFLQLLTLG
jgi:hypothetical protein